MEDVVTNETLGIRCEEKADYNREQDARVSVLSGPWHLLILPPASPSPLLVPFLTSVNASHSQNALSAVSKPRELPSLPLPWENRTEPFPRLHTPSFSSPSSLASADSLSGEGPERLMHHPTSQPCDPVNCSGVFPCGTLSHVRHNV